MKKFYDRKNELKILEQIEKNSYSNAAFTIITGRRRIGKTALLKKFISKKKAATFLPPEAPSPFYASNGKKNWSNQSTLKFLEA